MACQWYPKPAVFDKNGWHEFPYLDMGEFYSEYADYSSALRCLPDYVIGATGVLQNNDELQSYKTIGAKIVTDRKGKPVLYTTTFQKREEDVELSCGRCSGFRVVCKKDFVIRIRYCTAIQVAK